MVLGPLKPKMLKGLHRAQGAFQVFITWYSVFLKGAVDRESISSPINCSFFGAGPPVDK